MSIQAGLTRLIHEVQHRAEQHPKKEKIMKRVQYAPARSAGVDLKQIVEPLANYVCAAREPKQALLSVVAALRHEVEITNRAALSYFRSYSEN
jgi:hypothetical protein